MLGRTHLIFGLLLTMIAVKYYDRISDGRFYHLVGASIILFISIMPDIDESKSWLGRRFKPLSWSLTHRGFFHSFLFMVLIFLIILSFETILAFTFLFAFLGHLLLDAMSVHGITPFWPFPWKLKGRIKTGSKAENALTFLLIVLIVTVIAVF